MQPAKPNLGLGPLTPAWGPSQSCPTPAPAHPEGLGELLQGGEGDGVRPRLSRPAEATSELLVGTDNIGRAKTGTTCKSQHAPLPKPGAGRAGAHPLHIRLSGGGLAPAASATRSPVDRRWERLGLGTSHIRTSVYSRLLGHLTSHGSLMAPHSIPDSVGRL